VNGQNKSLGEDDNAMIFRLIEEVVDDDDIEEEVEEESDEKTEAPSQSYEEIDGSIPIARGPLRIENPKSIPLLNGGWKAENN
jgi:hypothetical protein